ncbi:CDP-glycerol glycerophosphotransferase family protein [Blautia massiliensis (ex Durand et al. 2017)]|uniref:CDP-glycerol glycerophosphotransferase family protein n=1 Tax=Blautia massiliensis (ex Durand et al. 2017) TaxID=1737424 RepID=UPI0022E155F1|nr:CDP-glycerol glycerophosphotransferase family protein [Blautia massiliensis (ex Durand et al. 2017)]
MKNLIIELSKIMLHVFFIFPIKNNRIFFSAYSGRQYSCNPKYISEWIEKNYSGKFEIIWAFEKKEMFQNVNNTDIKCVKFKSIQHLYYLLTSKVVVDNVESWSILPKRNGQYIVNTWHGGGAYKGVGLRRKDTSKMLDKNMLKKNERISVYLSSSKAFSQMTLRDSFHYKGEIIEYGMPRNDLLLENNEKKKSFIRKKLGIPENIKIVIYAPTFRHNLEYKYMLNYNRTLKALEAKSGNEWIMLVRTHYYLEGNGSSTLNVKNVSDYPDMQELLLVSDVLITDYSSSIWDFSLMKKPGFLFIPDYNDYMDERELYTPIQEWPYPACFSMNDLEKEIKEYNSVTAEKRIDIHHSKLGICESGKATEIIGKKIIKWCNYQ